MLQKQSEVFHDDETGLQYTIITVSILLMRTTDFFLAPQVHYWAASISVLLIGITAGEAFS